MKNIQAIIKNINIKGTLVNIYKYVNGSYVISFNRDGGSKLYALYKDNKWLATADADPKLIIYKSNGKYSDVVNNFAKDFANVYNGVSEYFESNLLEQGFDGDYLKSF